MSVRDDAEPLMDHLGGSADNFPGFEYLQRVSSATVRAMAAHAEEMNGAWSNIRRGGFDFGSALKMWAKVTENYYGVVTEAFRGPSQVARPAWLVVPFSKGTKRTPNFSVLIDGVVEKGAPLDYTKFESFGWDRGRIGDLYAEPPEGAGSRVIIRLDADEIRNVPSDTDLVSFIMRKAAGSAPPLVIVLLHVAD